MKSTAGQNSDLKLPPPAKLCEILLYWVQRSLTRGKTDDFQMCWSLQIDLHTSRLGLFVVNSESEFGGGDHYKKGIKGSNE